jgi:uncharacterized RDD family membrane protein YckC
MPAGQSPVGQLADWPTRALSAVIDFFGPFVIANVLYYANHTLGYILWFAALGWSLFQAYQAGATGQSYGRKIAGTRLLTENTGQLIGGGMGIARYFVHILDVLPCYIGFLWPIWDKKRQTFADKIIKTVVIKI